MIPDVGSGIDMGMYGLAVGAFNDDEYPDFAVVTGSAMVVSVRWI